MGADPAGDLFSSNLEATPSGAASKRRRKKRQNRLGKDDGHLSKGKSHSASSGCIIWVPRDSLGIAENESYHARKYNKRLVISSKGAVLNRDGRIVLSSGPPEAPQK